MLFKVQKNGVDGWHEVEADSPQDAVEKYYGIEVYLWEQKGESFIFDDFRPGIEQLYAAIEAGGGRGGGSASGRRLEATQ